MLNLLRFSCFVFAVCLLFVLACSSEENNKNLTPKNRVNSEQYSNFNETKSKAKKELAAYKSEYSKIDSLINDKYSGFNNHYRISKGENSFFTRLDYKQVQFYADLSDLIYVKKYKEFDDVVRELELKLKDDNYKEYELLSTLERNFGKNSKELSAIFLYNESINHLIVVFKGTVTMADWLKNISFKNYSGLDPSESLKAIDGSSLNIHEGFARAYIEGLSSAFLYKFDDFFINRYTVPADSTLPLRITTTGHSLGGALALILANDLPRLLIGVGKFFDDSQVLIETITFGAPRVYDAQSSRIVEQALAGAHNIIRIVNEGDPVPDMPSKTLLGGADIGTPIYIPYSGFVKNPLQHMMGKYAKESAHVFKKIKQDALKAREVKDKIIELKAELGDKSENLFDKVDEREKLKMLLDKNKSRLMLTRRVLKMVRDEHFHLPLSDLKEFEREEKLLIENNKKLLSELGRLSN
ncbi:MAG: lipase family protein [Myxococcales bacterium]|nr:lipase family protein [Myxococcales bacterium]USN50699.1 MAG: lipase family protein [Myxococcales bacterium]